MERRGFVQAAAAAVAGLVATKTTEVAAAEYNVPTDFDLKLASPQDVFVPIVDEESALAAHKELSRPDLPTFDDQQFGTLRTQEFLGKNWIVTEKQTNLGDGKEHIEFQFTDPFYGVPNGHTVPAMGAVFYWRPDLRELWVIRDPYDKHALRRDVEDMLRTGRPWLQVRQQLVDLGISRGQLDDMAIEAEEALKLRGRMPTRLMPLQVPVTMKPCDELLLSRAVLADCKTMVYDVHVRPVVGGRCYVKMFFDQVDEVSLRKLIDDTRNTRDVRLLSHYSSQCWALNGLHVSAVSYVRTSESKRVEIGGYCDSWTSEESCAGVQADSFIQAVAKATPREFMQRLDNIRRHNPGLYELVMCRLQPTERTLAVTRRTGASQEV